MGIIQVWVPEVPPLSPESQQSVDHQLELHLANPDLVKAHMEKFQITESMPKYREDVLLNNNNKEIKLPSSPVFFTPAIDTSAPTCATEALDSVYKLLLAESSSRVIKIINPATGEADDVFKASMMKRYCQDGIADEVLGGGSMLKRPREDLGESSKTVTAVSGIANEVLGGSLLKRPRNDLDESSKTVFTASDEVLGGSVLNRHCKDQGESNETVVAESESESATPTTNTGGAASGDNQIQSHSSWILPV